MKTLTDQQAQADNIISLFGQNIIEQLIEENEESLFMEDEESVLFESRSLEDVFAPRILSPDLGLEMGFTIIADQIEDLKKKLKRTSFYLNDLENLIS